MGPKKHQTSQLGRDGFAGVAVKSNQRLTPDPTLEFRPQVPITTWYFYFRPPRSEGAVKISAGKPTSACLKIVLQTPRPAMAGRNMLKQDLRHCQSFLADPPRGSCSRFDEFQQRAD